MQNIANSDLYFFNNMYDDKTVFEEMIQNRRKNFYQCLRHQALVQGFDHVEGTMDQFTIEPLVNQTLGLPKNTYTLHIDRSIVPYYSKKRFLDKYRFNQPISTNTIFEDNATFNHTLLCQIGEYYTFDIEVAESISGCYIILRAEATKITNAYLSELRENKVPWTVFFQNRVEIFYAYKMKYSIFTGITDSEYYYLPLENFKKISTIIKKPDTTNQWNLFCSCVKGCDNLTMGTHAIIVKKNGKDHIRVPLAFATYILANSTDCKCYLMNAYRRLNSKIIETKGSTSFSTTIEYITNPIPPSNVYVYEWDESNQVRKKMFRSEIALTHPNLYNIAILLEDGELISDHIYIEWYEAAETQCRFDNIMRDLILYYGKQFYDKLSSGELSTDVCEYLPANLTQYDYREFMASEHYPDIRQFRLDCLIEMLQDNPKRYKSLIKKLYSNIREVIRHTLVQSKDPEIFNREVMDTSGEVPDRDYAFFFTEPMIYFNAHLARDIVPAVAIFVNGYRVNTEYVHTVNRECYIYMKKSNLDPNKDNIVELEIYLHDNTVAHKTEGTIRFFSTGMSTIIKEKHSFDPYLPVTYYSFIDARTKLPLKSEEITFRYSLDETQLKAMSGEPIEFFFKREDETFFKTNNEEFFIDETCTALAVRHEAIIEDIPSDSHKFLDTEFLFLVLNSSFRVNDDIIITNNNNYRKEYQSDAMKGTSLTMVKFREKLSRDRFRVFYSGKLLDEEDYDIILPLKYNEDVIVNVRNVSAQHKRRDIIVEYLPIDESLLFSGIPDITVYHDGLFWFDHLDFPIIPEMMKVYINGLRIPREKIIDVGAINIFHLPDYKIGDSLKIFIPALDSFKYGLNTSKKILNSEMERNDDFRNYMVEKAKKKQ